MKNKIKMDYIFIVAVLLLLMGCSAETASFKKGVGEMKKINEKYGADFKSMPNTMENAVLMRNELKQISEDNMAESFKLFLDYKIKSLEANIINLKGWEHGMKASVRDGFGCKSLPIIVNSSILRNASAQKGYEAVKALQEFVDKYPKEALSINITQRDVVFSNFYYYEVEREAKNDRRVVVHFCGNETKSNETKKEGG